MSLALHVTNKVPTSFPVISMDHLQYMFSLHKCMCMSRMKKKIQCFKQTSLHLKIWFSPAHKQYIKPDVDVIFN